MPEGEKAPNFLQKERTLTGLSPVLQEKVRLKFLDSFDEAKQMAKAKDLKMKFQSNFGRRENPSYIHEQPL